MSPYEAAAFMAGELNQNAVEWKPKQTSAPKPTDDIEGGSVDADTKYQYIMGATFE